MAHFVTTPLRTSRFATMLAPMVVLLVGFTPGRAGAPTAGAYFGQPAPGRTPRLFAPGLVNSGLPTRDITFSPDGLACYFRVMDTGAAHATLVTSRLVAGRWTAPEVPAFAQDPRWKTMEPCITPSGDRLLFVSDRPVAPGSTQALPMGIWSMDRAPGGAWAAPRRLAETINGADGSFFPSVTRDGTLYFARDGEDGSGQVCRARRQGEGYGPVAVLPPVVQCGKARYNPFISPDESFMILCAQGLPQGQGSLDYQVLFRNGQDQWSLPQNLGVPVNDPGVNVSACVSPDGRYLFFASNRLLGNAFPPGAKLKHRNLLALARRPGHNGATAIYWVDAGLLETLRSTAVFPAP